MREREGGKKEGGREREMEGGREGERQTVKVKTRKDVTALMERTVTPPSSEQTVIYDNTVCLFDTIKSMLYPKKKKGREKRQTIFIIVVCLRDTIMYNCITKEKNETTCWSLTSVSLSKHYQAHTIKPKTRGGKTKLNVGH